MQRFRYSKVIWATSGWFECCGCSAWWDSAWLRLVMKQTLCLASLVQSILETREVDPRTSISTNEINRVDSLRQPKQPKPVKILSIPPWLQTVLAILTYLACSSHTQEAIQGCFACKSIWVCRSKLVQYHLLQHYPAHSPLTLAWKVMKMSRNLWLLVQGFIAPWTCKVQISLGSIGKSEYSTFCFFWGGPQPLEVKFTRQNWCCPGVFQHAVLGLVSHSLRDLCLSAKLCRTFNLIVVPVAFLWPDLSWLLLRV